MMWKEQRAEFSKSANDWIRDAAPSRFLRVVLNRARRFHFACECFSVVIDLSLQVHELEDGSTHLRGNRH